MYIGIKYNIQGRVSKGEAMGHLSNNTQLSLLSFHSKTGMKACYNSPFNEGKRFKATQGNFPSRPPEGAGP